MYQLGIFKDFCCLVVLGFLYEDIVLLSSLKNTLVNREPAACLMTGISFFFCRWRWWWRRLRVCTGDLSPPAHPQRVWWLMLCWVLSALRQCWTLHEARSWPLAASAAPSVSHLGTPVPIWCLGKKLRSVHEQGEHVTGSYTS